jgi:hypothetical protein
MYNTNFSILKYKGKTIFEYLKDFRNVHFSISLDGLGEVGEFVRTGFDNKVFNTNFMLLKWAIEHYKNISYDFQYTCSVLNAFNFFDFLKELNEDHNLINFHWVKYPFWYNTIHFDEIKSDIIRLYKQNLYKIESEKLKNSLLAFIEYLKKSTVSEWDKINALKYFKGNIAHTLIFNDLYIPKKFNFIQNIMNAKPKLI